MAHRFAGISSDHLPMLLTDLDTLNINTVSEPPPFLPNLNIIATHLALPHPAVLCKCPVLEAIASLPLHSILSVLVLVPELDCDFVVLEYEELLAKAVVLLFLPLGGEEGDYVGMAAEEGRAVAPDGVFRIGLGYLFRVSGARSEARLLVFVKGEKYTVYSRGPELS